MPELSPWTNFYVITGSSAGALIGLQFVVLTLAASLPNPNPNPAQVQMAAVFTTPTVVHFAMVLLLSAALCAPWPDIVPLAIIVAGAGLGGCIYMFQITRYIYQQHRRGQGYQIVFEDWLFHVILPLLAYALLVVSAVGDFINIRQTLFLLGAAVLLLLASGIHNAWDLIAYHVFVRASTGDTIDDIRARDDE